MEPAREAVQVPGHISMPSSPTLLAQTAPVRKPAQAVQADLDALVKAARAEGELLFYLAPVEAIGKRVSDGFTGKYGIKSAFVRLAGARIFQRYATEAEAGGVLPDVVITSGTGTIAFAEDAIKKGWVESIAQAGLPVVSSGEFPASAYRGPTGLVQVAAWRIAFNTEKLKGIEIPRDYPDLLNPKYKGQLLIPDPRSADAYIEFFSLLLDKYGEPFFAQLRAQNPRFFANGGVPAMQALAAGEGAVLLPAVLPQSQAIKDAGGPVDSVRTEYTTGIENSVMLTTRARSKHPNAGRLFANYLMSPEGNRVLNADPGSATIYDSAGLPKQYMRPSPEALARKDQIVRLLAP